MKPGSTVAVFGMGAVGLAVIERAKKVSSFKEWMRLLLGSESHSLFKKGWVNDGNLIMLVSVCMLQAGASYIYAIDINPAKFPIAMEWGASECLNPKVRRKALVICHCHTSV